MTKQKIIFLIMLIFLSAGAGFLLWQDWLNTESPELTKGSPLGNAEVVEEVLVDTQDRTISDNSSDSSDVEVSTLEINIPDLNRQIAASVSDNAVSEIKEISQTLKNNYNYLQGWLQLGILYQDMGDYEGAREAWEFASILRPNDSISLHNLGNLYGYYLHDNQKAEEYFLRAIEKEPTDIYLYYKTYEFYTDTDQSQKARQILERGISANPNTSQSLQSTLNNL